MTELTVKTRMQALADRGAAAGILAGLRVADWAEQAQGPRSGVGHRPTGPGNAARAEAPDWEEGSTTVEYAIGAIATAGFAALLIAVLKSGGVKAMITSVIESALSI